MCNKRRIFRLITEQVTVFYKLLAIGVDRTVESNPPRVYHFDNNSILMGDVEGVTRQLSSEWRTVTARIA